MDENSQDIEIAFDRSAENAERGHESVAPLDTTLGAVESALVEWEVERAFEPLLMEESLTRQPPHEIGQALGQVEPE